MVTRFDYGPLRRRIIQEGFTQKTLAEKVGISEGQFCQKLAGNYPFKQDDIEAICTVLNIRAADIGSYFFAKRIE